MVIELRLATMEDVPALKELIPASVRALSQDHYTPEQIETAVSEIFGVDTQLISDGTYFLAEAAGQIVGCGGWSKRQTLFGSDAAKSSTSDDLLDPAKDAARVRAFYVHPNWARRGIGRQVLQRCEDAARSAGFTKLELVATLPGEPLYGAMGYSVIEPTVLPMSKGRSLAAYRMGKVL
jgi:GNAT superfamily N-acetyltransferase